MGRAHQIILDSHTSGAPCQEPPELQIVLDITERPLDRLFSFPVLLFTLGRTHLRGHPPPFCLVLIAQDDSVLIFPRAVPPERAVAAVRAVIHVHPFALILVLALSAEELAAGAAKLVFLIVIGEFILRIRTILNLLALLLLRLLAVRGACISKLHAQPFLLAMEVRRISRVIAKGEVTCFVLVQPNSWYPSLMPHSIDVHELGAGDRAADYVFTRSMYNLRIGASGDNVVVSYLWVESE